MTVQVPYISPAEIESFHDAHFSSAAIASFSTGFLPTGNVVDAHRNQPWQLEHDSTEEEYYQEEDDDLGHYPDGVKRTLTDEQIEIFRHSELESLRRAEEKAAKFREQSPDIPKYAKETLGHQDGMDDDSMPPTRARRVYRSEAQSGSEDGELDEDDTPQHLSEADAKRLKKKRARQRKKEKSKKFHSEPKPDLRKRTWDVVEAGMDSLDYDGFEDANSMGGDLHQKEDKSHTMIEVVLCGQRD